MQPMVNIALRAARAAGEQIVRAVERLDLIKSEQSDVAQFLHKTCKQVEQTVVVTIQKAYPSHTVIGEYTGRHEALEEGQEFIWHLTPADSISNLANALPQFALCLAGEQNGRIEHAVILNPMSSEEFTASRGKGSQLNGRRIRVSNNRSLDKTLIGTGFINRPSDKPYLNNHLEMFKNISLSDAQVINSSSPALNLAYTAAGRLDGYFQIGLNRAEIEAGLLILQEAGGLAGDFTGGNNYRTSGNLVAGNPKMFKALLQAIRPAVTPDMH